MTRMTERRAARSMALLLLAGVSVPALAQETPAADVPAIADGTDIVVTAPTSS